MKHRLVFAALVGVAALGSQSIAQVIAPSTYTTMLQVQGEAEGTEFDDWAAAGIPIAVSDPLDNPGGTPLPFVDINTVQIANDADYIYVRVTTHSETISALASGMYLAFDTDQDAGTGFNIFELGEIGSEVGYLTDYPYQQDIGTFNTGVEGVVDYGGDFIGLALTFPFYDAGPPVGTQMEWAIPIGLAVGPTGPGSPVFTGDSFDMMVWSDQGGGDVTEVITYTLAAAPTVTGDYNGDGFVDAADYTVWRDSEGDIGADLPADGDGDMDVDGDDYTIWADNYGSSGALAVSVPEPATAGLVLLASAALALRRRVY